MNDRKRLTNVAIYLMTFLTFSILIFPVYVYGQSSGTIYGVVVDEYDRVMENVKIDAYTSDGAYVKNGSTSSDGSFGLDLDVGRSYVLYFSKEGYAVASKSVYLRFFPFNIGDIVLLKALRLSSPVLSRTASPGDKLTLSFTVSNIGEEPEMVEFLTTKPEGWSTRILDQTGEVTKVYLSPDLSISLQLEVEIPTTSTGTNSLTLTAAEKTSPTLNFTITVEPSSKPIILCQFSGKSAAPGETVGFQIKVKNPFGVKLRFRVAVDSIPHGWNAHVKSASGEAVTEVTLDANELADLTVSVSVPREEKSGEYNVVFRASSPAKSENQTLLVVVEKDAAEAGVDLQAIRPHLDAYASTRAKFRLKLTNGGGYAQLFGVKVEGLPEGLRAWFEGSNGAETTRVYVEPRRSEEFYVVIPVPREQSLGVLNFTVSAVGPSVTKSIMLTLNVLGQYEIEIVNDNFFIDVPVGGQQIYELTLRNTGTEAVTNVQVATVDRVPSGFKVDVKPTVLSSLNPDEEATLTITLTTQPEVDAGNYYVNFQVQSDQTESTRFSLQTKVEQQMNWVLLQLTYTRETLVGIILLELLVIALLVMLVIRKLPT